MAMMLSSLAAPALLAPVAPIARAPAGASAKMALVDSMEGVGEETGGQIWDPLGISEAVSDEAVMWFRASELKHGRVAMLASVGYLVGAAKISFPGELAKGVTFASVAANGPYQAWDAVPQAGKLQILSIILALEWATEAKKPHYMRGGVPGKIEQLPFDGIQGLWAPKIKFWDPLNFTGALSAEQKARKRKAELKNGRLAMIGIISFITGHNLPGSVPALDSSF
eukprot:CAMPEP_0185283652 /NCGR_PEP_ID=MMETSP1363-20130426/603_1 /TAXON_ID=38817 /ORGANISM="Gephyrocapsa oceanica, Strain RCC1303" /LENGTH=224 /DNA_ID=CAMNT_0027879319 /DNA_START=89 /DNA_END=763 /DNA_ORIENTATION=-